MMKEIRPIDANAAIEMLRKYVTRIGGNFSLWSSDGISENNIDRAINQVPTLDYAPVVHAHWIIGRDPDGCIFAIVCSHCNENYGTPTDRFCRNCGAKMDEATKNE